MGGACAFVSVVFVLCGRSLGILLVGSDVQSVCKTIKLKRINLVCVPGRRGCFLAFESKIRWVLAKGNHVILSLRTLETNIWLQTSVGLRSTGFKANIRPPKHGGCWIYSEEQQINNTMDSWTEAVCQNVDNFRTVGVIASSSKVSSGSWNVLTAVTAGLLGPPSFSSHSLVLQKAHSSGSNETFWGWLWETSVPGSLCWTVSYLFQRSLSVH